MAIPDKYLVAFTAQADINIGVTTKHRLGWVSAKEGSIDLEQILIFARELHGVTDEFRIISSLICPMQPFDNPTECQVAVTLMPGGVGFSARLRQSRRTVMISDDYTLCDAFGDLLNEETADSVIAWSYTPINFYPAS